MFSFKNLYEKVKTGFKNKFYNKPVTVKSCPFCGSSNINAFSVLANFVQVINGTEDARYIQSATCSDCGKKFVLEEDVEIITPQKGK